MWNWLRLRVVKIDIPLCLGQDEIKDLIIVSDVELAEIVGGQTNDDV